MLVGSLAVFISTKRDNIITLISKKKQLFVKTSSNFLLQAFGPIKLDRGLGYACPYCQKTMPHAAAMKQHIYTHTGEKPYKCTFCSYATNQPGTLNRHVNKLHKENLWTINVAIQYKFEQILLPCYLQMEPIKLGHQQYACPLCSKIFTRTNAVKRHLLMHTGEKPFVCSFCPYATRERPKLKQHITKTHPDVVL